MFEILIHFDPDPTPVPLPAVAASANRLLQPRPNPVRGAGTFRVVLAAPARVALGVYDLSGRRVRMLDLGDRAPGLHEVGFSALPAGVYFQRLMVDGRVGDVAKFVVLR